MRLLLLSALRRPAAFTPITKSFVSRTLTTSTRPTIVRQLPLRTNNAFSKPASKRFFTTEPAIIARPTQSEAYRKLLYGAGVFGGTLFGINILFNSEKREGGIPAFEHQYLKETFTYTGMGIGMIGVAAKALHNVGWSNRLMAANPWVVLGVGLGGSLITMFGTLYTDPDNYIQKHAFWTAFNLTQAVTLAPLFFYNPAILARAGLYTVGIMGSISYVAATAKEDKYLWLGGPLLAGCAVVVLSSLAPMVLPVGTAALAGAEAISLYGGLALFGGFTLYDVQKVQYHARLAEQGSIKKDTVNESVKLELDFLNIFIRMVQILGNRQNNKR
ncbi:inhibitor of apoptosis-promoting Bax1-domain-containing protein [Trichophaea hybrida]|nr:inhibitor of apoptosis-promoting Bax1-domain-containing protein [Trichophaea hybrida]